MQNEWLKVEHSERNGYKGVSVYRLICDELGDEIEKFRAKIYKTEPNIEKHFPFTERFTAIKNGSGFDGNATGGDTHGQK